MPLGKMDKQSLQYNGSEISRNAITLIEAKSYITPWFSGGGFFGGAFGCTMDFTFPIGLGLTSSRL